MKQRKRKVSGLVAKYMQQYMEEKGTMQEVEIRSIVYDTMEDITATTRKLEANRLESELLKEKLKTLQTKLEELEE